MTLETPIRHRLVNISPKAYEHPADRAATAALKAIPYLDVVVRRLIEFNYERAYRQVLLGNSVKIGENQLPDLYHNYLDVLDVLDMPERYDLYVQQTPAVNAMAIGAGKPIIVLNSGLVNMLDERQTKTVIAHEVGHILSDHVLYRTALIILLQLSSVALPIFVGLPLLAIRLALLEWFRAAELSCDRAATLAVRDPQVTARVMMNLAGGTNSEKLNLDAFIEQAKEYENWNDGYDKAQRFFVEIGATHPFPVWRVQEILKWVQSGDYDRILRGEYPKRNEAPNPAREAGDAVNFYGERFNEAFKSAGESAQSMASKMGDWLRKAGEPREDNKN